MARKKKNAMDDDLDAPMDLGGGFNFEDAGIEDLTGGDDLGGGGQLDDVMTKLNEIEGKLARLDTSNQTMRTEIESVRSNMDKTEDNIKKLLSVYELVSKKFNPFIGMTDEGGDDWEMTDTDLMNADAPLPIDDDFSLPTDFGADMPEPDMNDDPFASAADAAFGDPEEEEKAKEAEKKAEEEKAKEEEKADKKDVEDIKKKVDDLERFPSTDVVLENLVAGEDGRAYDYGMPYKAPFQLTGVAPWEEPSRRRRKLKPKKPAPEMRKPQKRMIKVERKPEPKAVPKPAPRPALPSHSPAPLAAGPSRNENGILTFIKPDYITIVLVLRWIEFMFERVKRDKISLLLDYYRDIGWISEEVKGQVMSYARGEVQDVTTYEPEEEDELLSAYQEDTDIPRDYKKISDWRLSAEDHLKSLLFIQKVAGIDVNKDRLNSLEQEITRFKRSLEGFHGV